MHIKQLQLTSKVMAIIFIALTLPALAQDFEQVKIKTEKISEGIYMLIGRGGNIGISVGEDGVFLIDDQYAPLSEKIKTAVASLNEGPIRFILNTHWHGDHTGGNEAMGEVGALIVAHENVRKRLNSEQFMAAFDRRVPPAPKGALPVVTFTDAVTFHLNGNDIFVFHVKSAHTDGDAVVYFKKSNVIHMGDIYFAGGYPFIDLSSGGSVNGVIEAVNQVIGMIDEDTKVIPGHGALSDRHGLLKYLDMLVTIRDRISVQVKAGKSLDNILASKPTADFDESQDRWFSPENFVKILYEDLSK